MQSGELLTTAKTSMWTERSIAFARFENALPLRPILNFLGGYGGSLRWEKRFYFRSFASWIPHVLWQRVSPPFASQDRAEHSNFKGFFFNGFELKIKLFWLLNFWIRFERDIARLWLSDSMKRRRLISELAPQIRAGCSSCIQVVFLLAQLRYAKMIWKSNASPQAMPHHDGVARPPGSFWSALHAHLPPPNIPLLAPDSRLARWVWYLSKSFQNLRPAGDLWVVGFWHRMMMHVQCMYHAWWCTTFLEDLDHFSPCDLLFHSWFALIGRLSGHKIGWPGCLSHLNKTWHKWHMFIDCPNDHDTPNAAIEAPVHRLHHCRLRGKMFQTMPTPDDPAWTGRTLHYFLTELKKDWQKFNWCKETPDDGGLYNWVAVSMSAFLSPPS